MNVQLLLLEIRRLSRELMHPTHDKVSIGYSLAHAEVKKLSGFYSHRLSGSELYHILAGEGQMFIDDTSFNVETGDSFVVPPSALQHIKNTGSESLCFLCIVSLFWQESDEIIE